MNTNLFQENFRKQINSYGSMCPRLPSIFQNVIRTKNSGGIQVEVRFTEKLNDHEEKVVKSIASKICNDQNWGTIHDTLPPPEENQGDLDCHTYFFDSLT